MSNPFLTNRWFELPDKAKQHLEQMRLLSDLDKAIDSPYLENFTVAAGRRSYKTERAAKRWAVKQAIRKSDKVFWFGAPTQGQSYNIFWNDLKALINPIYIKSKSESKHEIILHNNTSLKLFGLKEYERVEGQRADVCIITEWQQCEIEAYSQTLQPILNDSCGLFLFEGRPFGKNHLYDFYMKGQSGEERWHSYWWSAEDILSKEQIKAAKDSLSLLDYQREYQASFETGTASPYYAYDANFNHEVHKLDPNNAILIMCDFNATIKPMSWAIGQRVNNKTYLTKTFQHQFTNTKTMCSIVKDYLEEQFKDKYLHLRFYGDYAGNQQKSNSSQSDWEIIQEEFRNLGKIDIRVKPCLSIRDSIAATNAQLCNANGERKLFIDYENCKALVTDWNKVEWKDNGKEIKEEDMLGHVCRAVDYYNDYEFPVIGKPKIQHSWN